MALKSTLLSCISHITLFFKWLLISLFTGSIVGVISSVFSRLLVLSNQARSAYPMIVLGLPAAGLAIVFLYRFFKNADDTGTNQVITSIHSSSDIPFRVAPLIFVSTILTQLCGGSAGREGAALQLGGSIGNRLGKLFHLDPNKQHIIIMCGMSAGFSALFGTPMAAAIFSMEVISVGIMHYSALVPCVVSSFTAYFIARLFHCHAEAFAVSDILPATPVTLLKILLFGVVVAGVSILFCMALHKAEHLYKKWIPNLYIRAFAAGCIVLLLAAVLRTDFYLGSGMSIIESIFEGHSVAFYVCLLKILFTALTLGGGFKGGEIVPSLCIGAAFGGFAAPLLGLSPSLVAACGMVGVFCGVTNCPISSLLISFELFGFEGMPYYLVTIAVSYMLSGYYGLYRSQKIVYSKEETHYVNQSVH